MRGAFTAARMMDTDELGQAHVLASGYDGLDMASAATALRALRLRTVHGRGVVSR